MKDWILVLILSLFLGQTGANATTGFTVSLRVYSSDGCYYSSNSINVDIYNECTILQCQQERAHFSQGCPGACNDETYRTRVQSICEAQANGFNRIAGSCPLGSLEQEVSMTDDSEREALSLAMGVCRVGLTARLPGRPDSFYRSSCRAMLAARRDNYANVLNGIFQLDPHNLDNLVEGVQALCQEVDSGIFAMELTLRGGQKVTVNLWEPEENRYENGCFQRLPPAALLEPEFQHFKSYVPVRSTRQYLETPDSIPHGPHDLNARATHTLTLMDGLVQGNETLLSTTEFNISGQSYEENYCAQSGLCGRRQSPVGLQTFQVDGIGQVILPGLGPKTTPRICQSLVAAAASCWRIHNDAMAYSEAMLMMVGAFEGVGVVGQASKITRITRPRNRLPSRSVASRVLTNARARPRVSSQARTNARSRLKQRLNLSDDAFARRFPCAR